MFMLVEFTKNWAIKEDKECTLNHFREAFTFPVKNNKPIVYFTGNSLGLQCKASRNAVIEHLDKWANEAVDGHFEGNNRWFDLHAKSKKGFAYLMGTEESEVSVMNGLTTNLHLMLSSFYNPKGTKKKIIIEDKAFPSDYYVVESFLRLQGFEAQENILEIPFTSGRLFTTEAILEFIEKHANETALIMLGGVNYYTGQVLDMEAITAKANALGIVIGWDLAHAAGNVALNLHDWNADFACWCTYKYLNAGPGSPSGIFVHKKHHNSNLPRMAGWWGYDQETRFAMEKKFVPMQGADGWQQSNGPALAMATIAPSLDLFLQAGKEKLFAKREALSQYLIEGLMAIQSDLNLDAFEIITPLDSKQRGSQVSVYVKKDAEELFAYLENNNVLPDFRKPNVIRFAPVPLYNNFQDILSTLELIKAFYTK